MPDSIPKNNARFKMIGILLTLAGLCSLKSLAALHLTNNHLVDKQSSETVIEMEKLPAQRGLIMDCQEQILTNNIQTAEIKADRNHLRSLNTVVEGLAYNAATNDEAWALANEEKREGLIRKKKELLIKNAKIVITQEERDRNRELRRLNQEHQISDITREEYQEEVLQEYYHQHDILISQVLYPYLKHDRVNRKGETIAGLSQEDIIALIEQPEVAAGERSNYRIDYILAKDIPLEKGKELRQALEQARIRGLVVQNKTHRSYVYPLALSHVLGRINSEQKGVNGVEYFFDSYLQGLQGLREYRSNAAGRITPHADDRYISAEHGLNLRLTIDMRLQRIVEEEFDKGMTRFNAQKGCFIIVEPQTGNIKAMVSRPALDLNTAEILLPDKKIPHNNTLGPKGSAIGGEFNFATQARYEPGSTMKVVAVTAAVDNNIYNINNIVSCERFTANGTIPAVTDGRFNYHALPLWGVLKKSSNPGAARIAFACKWPLFEEYIKRFGLDDSTGICLPSGGKCNISDGTNRVNFSRMAYGYSLSVSPLHMAMVYATIANDGVRMKPRLVDKIIAQDGSIYDECKPEEACRVMKSSTAADLRKALHHVTLTEKAELHGNGTARAAAIGGFKVGGKTGTAEKLTESKVYSDDLATVSFAGVFPIDKPQYVALVVIDEPHPTDRNIGGGSVAAPIFRRAMMRIIDELQIPADDPEAYRAFCQKQAEADAERLKNQKKK